MAFSFLFVSFAWGQTTHKLLRGKVVVPNQDVTGIAIQNLNTKNATITDFEGNFSIPVRLNDTLVFTAVQLRQKKLPITKTIFDATFITVPMEAFVNELREVVVRPYSLTGNLGTDMATMEVRPVTAESLGLPNAHEKIPTQSQRRLQQATTTNGLVSLTKFLNAITGRTRMLKDRVALERTYAQTQSVQASIVDSLFTTELNIPKNRIADFMYFCEVDDEFQQLIPLQDQLKLWEYLVRRSQLYLTNNGLD